MARFFISYRRGPTTPHARAVAENLSHRFGEDAVFMDVDAIRGGVQWEEHIRRELSDSDAVIAVIGSDWLEARGETGERRLDSRDDVLRRELATALASDAEVIPVLVGEARLPRPSELPDDLQRLPGRQAIELRDTHWRSDIERLLDAAARSLPRWDRVLQRVPGGKWGVGVATVGVLLVAGWLLFADGGPTKWKDYESQGYRATYPEDWNVAADYQPDESQTRWTTQFKSPDGTLSVLIDHIPGEMTDPKTKAREVERAVQRIDRGNGVEYSQLLFEPLTISGEPAFQWNFAEDETRKVDLFLQLDGHGFAVLGEADAGDFAQVVPVARRIAESITPSE
jgi:hypothetical protein